MGWEVRLALRAISLGGLSLGADAFRVAAAA